MTVRAWRLIGNVIHAGRGTIRPGDPLPDVSEARINEWVGLGAAEWLPEPDPQPAAKPRGKAKADKT